jgi:O-antigen/teichoic acid export membrane protein
LSSLKKLAGQTAIYGLSSIVGRFLNYLLVPLHTGVFSTDQFGIITEMYAYVAFLVILLTYGMETAFFRFSTKENDKKEKVYSTIISSLVSSTFLFIALSVIFQHSVADWLRYPNNSEYVVWFAIIVGLDALSSIPLARLRQENKAFRFAFVNLSNVFVNIALNLFFIGYCLPMHQAGNSNFLIETFYNPEIGVGYVFIANLVASVFKFLLLLPEMLKARYGFDKAILKEMMIYSMPLLIAGLAGIINETLDRIMLKRMLFDSLGEKDTMSIIGIYGANYKVSIIITLFIQAFRYAAEPFFFAQAKEKDPHILYARIMNYFVIVCATIFLGVMLYIDILKYFIPNQTYWVGLKVVPILLLANVFLGIYYNQSVWYKLTDKTRYGALLAIFGAAITVTVNYFFIPEYNYIASAWATLACYGSMMVASYFLGQHFYPVPYNLGKIFGYIIAAISLYFISTKIPYYSELVHYSLNSLLMLLFLTGIYIIERPKKN